MLTDASFLKPLVRETGEALWFHSLVEFGTRYLPMLPRLPFSIRVVLEALLRQAKGAEDVSAIAAAFAQWPARLSPAPELPFLPARVLLQDFTGVPCVADLAGLRDALAARGRAPGLVEPLLPVDLVIDHSVQLDAAGCAEAPEINMRREFERNRERYAFLRWAQQAWGRLRVVPPGVGICHQVNLEHLATVVGVQPDASGRLVAFPDTVVGTDSHTTMINGLGVLGWGVGGIEAEAAMLGQPIPLLLPEVTGVRLVGRLRTGVTATDLALTVTHRLREAGVVGQFVEFFGPGLDALQLADRATVANMAPEYGATVGFFPVDAETIRYLRETGRDERHLDLVERYCRTQGLWREPDAPEPQFQRILELDLSSVEPSVAGPKKPHEQRRLSDLRPAFRKALLAPVQEGGYGLTEGELAKTVEAGWFGSIGHGTVVIASIASCTNTSNPALLLTAGLMARHAVARGLSVPPAVRTSFTPGSRAAAASLQRAGLMESLEQLGFHVAAFGCAACIGNSGPLDPDVEKAIREGRLVAAAVLSGNRNFEGRIHPAAKANFLCSPPLVVAFALAGRVDLDMQSEPLGLDAKGQPVFLRDIWPTEDELRVCLALTDDPQLYRESYQDLAAFCPEWDTIPVATGGQFDWQERSTYIRRPPFVENLPDRVEQLKDLIDARCLVSLGDFITTDHISPAGSIPVDSPAGRYLLEQGVAPGDFNSYGSRRGNHEVMARGTFANIRLRNRLTDREGGWTVHLPSGETLSLFDAAERYRAEGVPVLVLAGRLYGAGSSRDWAAKGPRLLGVRTVIAQSFERIHRSNLIGMGILPLEFTDGQSADSLGLTGRETFSLTGMAGLRTPGHCIDVVAVDGARTVRFRTKSRIDSEVEADYLHHGGILPFVFRRLLATG